MSRYVNPFTDFGFKKLFGEEPNKEVLIDFLNELLAGRESRIVDLRYLKNEHLASAKNDRRAIFDLYCETETGERFIVELQKEKHRFTETLASFPNTFPFHAKDHTYSNLKSYFIALLGFSFKEHRYKPDDYVVWQKLDSNHQAGSEHVPNWFVYVELPKFLKSLEQCQSRLDKWLWLFLNIPALDAIPASIESEGFLPVLDAASMASFSPVEVVAYRESLKHYWDMNNVFETARQEGHDAGMIEMLMKATWIRNKTIPSPDQVAAQLDIPVQRVVGALRRLNQL